MAYTSEIEKLERRHQENPKGRTFAILADHYRKAGEIDRALVLLHEGLEVHPDYPSALIVLGRCHLDRSDYHAAEEPFRRVLQIDAENGIALRAMADIAEHDGRPAEARRWLETLLSIDGSNESAREQLARVSGVQEPPVPAVNPIVGGGFDIQGGKSVDATPRDDQEPEAAALELEPTSFEGGFTPTPGSVWSGDELEREELFEAEGEETPGLEDMEAAPGLETTSLDIEPEEQGPPTLSSPSRADLDIGVERADEIVLRSTGSTEFQVASAAEDLGATLLPSAAPEEAAAGEPEAAVDEPAGAAEDEVPEFEEEGGSPAGSNWWDPAPEAGAEAVESTTAEAAGPPDTTDAAESHEADDEAALPAGQAETGLPWYSAFGSPLRDGDAAVEAGDAADVERSTTDLPDAGFERAGGEDAPESQDELPADAALPSDEPVSVPPRPAESEPQSPDEALPDPAPAFGITETLAEIYVAQGHHHEAILVYRQLLERDPGSERLREKLAVAEAVGARAGRTERRSYSAGESGGTSVGGYFAGILAARPAPADALPDAPSDRDSKNEESRPAAAAPTRPAADPLSLSAIFGEEGTAQGGKSSPRDESRVGAPPASPGLRFDEFFDSPPPAGTRPAEDDDLSQFHDWLKSLKN